MTLYCIAVCYKILTISLYLTKLYVTWSVLASFHSLLSFLYQIHSFLFPCISSSSLFLPVFFLFHSSCFPCLLASFHPFLYFLLTLPYFRFSSTSSSSIFLPVFILFRPSHASSFVPSFLFYPFHPSLLPPSSIPRLFPFIILYLPFLFNPIHLTLPIFPHLNLFHPYSTVLSVLASFLDHPL